MTFHFCTRVVKVLLLFMACLNARNLEVVQKLPSRFIADLKHQNTGWHSSLGNVR